MQKPTLKFSWSAVLTVILAVVLLFLAFRGVNWGEMLQTVQQGRMEYMFLAFCIMTVSYFLRSLRWRTLLTAEKPIHPLTTFWGTNVGYLGNYFLPARAGEVIRSALIAQRTGINFMYVVATILTERIVDAALLVLIVVALLPMLGTPPDWLISARQVMLVVGFGGLIGLLLAPRLEGFALSILARLPLPDALKEKLKTFLEKFLLGVRAFQQFGRGATFLALTIVIWSLDVVCAMQVAQAFDITLEPAQILFLLAALGLSSAVPSTPGYLGVYQFVTVSVLAPFGIGQSDALVYILAFQAMTYALVILWGMIGLWRLNTNLAAIRETARTADTAPLPPPALP
jgi:glycosyltransferase 2 family protein